MFGLKGIIEIYVVCFLVYLLPIEGAEGVGVLKKM